MLREGKSDKGCDMNQDLRSSDRASRKDQVEMEELYGLGPREGPRKVAPKCQCPVMCLQMLTGFTITSEKRTAEI